MGDGGGGGVKLSDKGNEHSVRVYKKIPEWLLSISSLLLLELTGLQAATETS